MSLTRSGYVLDKRLLGKEEVAALRRELTVVPLQEEANGPKRPPPPPLKAYLESDTHLCVPRYFASRRLRPADNAPQFRNRCARTDRLAFAGRLKEETRQVEASDACVACLREHGGGVMSLPTGFGKTTVALHVASRLGLKALVVVHKEFLMEQWMERIGQFLPQARVGRLQRDVCDVEEKDVVVSMIHSLSSKDYPDSALDGFGLVIFDEVHHVSAPMFSRCLFKTGVPFMLGLSATPFRKDGMHKVIEWFLGPLFFRVERTDEAGVRVQFVRYTCERYRLPAPTMRNGTLNLARMLTDMSEDEERNALILEHVRRCVLSQGRRVIVLADRRRHCIELAERAAGAGVASATCLGGTKNDVLQEAFRTAKALFGTYALANEGLDVPTLDTLIMASPRSDVVQAVGRILRETPGKLNRPLVIDVVDDHGVFYAQRNKRRQFYRKAGFHIGADGVDDDDDEPQPDIGGFAFAASD